MITHLRVLLDENLSTKLKYRFFHDDWFVSIVRDENWLGKKNGQPLKLMLENDFKVLITNDKSLIYQQNQQNTPIVILQLNAPSNRYDDLLVLVPLITPKLMYIKNIFEQQKSLDAMLLMQL